MVNSLWRGDWVQRNNEDEEVDYVEYEKAESSVFWERLNPHRLGVPRYQSAFRQIVWIFFLLGGRLLSPDLTAYIRFLGGTVYSQTVQRQAPNIRIIDSPNAVSQST